MTSRERWTVYPLLFLALGMGLRNRQMDVMHYKAIQCEELEVIDKQGNPVAVLGTTPKQDAMLQFMDQQRRITAIVGTASSSGILRLTGPDKQSSVNIGFEKPQAGMVVELPANNVVRIPVMVNVPIKPPTPPAAEPNAPSKEPNENKPEQPPTEPTPQTSPPEAQPTTKP
jgi:hypothetical protein